MGLWENTAEAYGIGVQDMANGFAYLAECVSLGEALAWCDGAGRGWVAPLVQHSCSLSGCPLDPEHSHRDDQHDDVTCEHVCAGCGTVDFPGGLTFQGEYLCVTCAGVETGFSMSLHIADSAPFLSHGDECRGCEKGHCQYPTVTAWGEWPLIVA